MDISPAMVTEFEVNVYIACLIQSMHYHRRVHYFISYFYASWRNVFANQSTENTFHYIDSYIKYRGADKSLALPGRKQATATEVLMFIYPIYNHNWRNISTTYIYNKTSIKRNILTIKQNISGSRSG
jgi:hypothetical protein